MGATKLKQAGNIDGVEIIHTSSRTLSTIHESNCYIDHVNPYINGDVDDQENMFVFKNRLYDSLSSTEWAQTVDHLVSKRGLQYPTQSIRKTFDRRYREETRDEAFEQLHVLNEMSNELREERERFDNCDNKNETENKNNDNNETNDLYDKDQHVLNARKSQLRRRIFKLQRDGEMFEPRQYSS